MNAIPKQVLICCALAATMPPLAAQHYRTRILEAPGAREVFVTDLADPGLVVGHSLQEDGSRHAWLWDLRFGTARDLTPAWARVAQARCVNADGQVAGVVVVDGGAVHPFLWEDGRFEDLAAAPGVPDWEVFVPREVGADGTILGQAWDRRGRKVAFLWTREDGFQELPEQEALGEAIALATATEDRRLLVAVPASGAAGAAIVVKRQGLLPLTGAADFVDIQAVSQRAQILGTVVRDPEDLTFEAALLDARDVRNRPQHLGTLGGRSSHALGVNDQEVVVGSARDAAEQPRAFLWRRGRMYDLNQVVPDLPDGLVLAEAVAITNRGCIAGLGRQGGRSVAWVLEPRRQGFPTSIHQR